jgi:spermidine/putrescine transport system ATP-binding protein
MSETVARLDRVSFSHPNAQILDRFTLDLPAGLFVTLLGPSGCGKTTILRLLGGFLRPPAGVVWLEGRDVTLLPPERRDVNMVFQDSALFPHLTVAGNVAFGLKGSGLSRAAVGEAVTRLLDLVRLGGLGERAPNQLSGGQRQRVALARALARDPKLLLLDEPLGALDAPLRAEMQAELRALQRRTGKTFLLVTHDQSEALAVSDVVGVLDKGRIVQFGPPETLYLQPATHFVAEFLGENNILRCRVDEVGAGGGFLAWRGQRLETTEAAGLQVGEIVEVAARPEFVRCAVRPQDRESLVSGRVKTRTFRGASILLSIELPGGETILASTTWSDAQAMGEEVCVRIDSRFIRVLDRQDRRSEGS